MAPAPFPQPSSSLTSLCTLWYLRKDPISSLLKLIRCVQVGGNSC